MIQQELSAQLSLRVLSCGSWHMPHHLALMALSLGQVLPARQRQDFVQDSCCQTVPAAREPSQEKKGFPS